ncbi:unnamed protein product [Penicillium bialowiezense]
MFMPQRPSGETLSEPPLATLTEPPSATVIGLAISEILPNIFHWDREAGRKGSGPTDNGFRLSSTVVDSGVDCGCFGLHKACLHVPPTSTLTNIQTLEGAELN